MDNEIERGGSTQRCMDVEYGWQGLKNRGILSHLLESIEKSLKEKHHSVADDLPDAYRIGLFCTTRT